MEKGNPMEEHYSQLSDAIMKAISDSPEINQLLTGLKEKGLITPESYFNFILSLEELSTMLEIPPIQTTFTNLNPGRKSGKENYFGNRRET